jgi:hypothetical protein
MTEGIVKGHLAMRLMPSVLAALVLAVAPAHAGNDQAGTSAANFLSIGTGPGVLAMGGAALGRSGSLELAGWNPASLGGVGETSFEFSHANLDDQTMQEWAILGGSFAPSRTSWAMTALYQNEGTFDGRDASNQSTGTFSVATAAAGVQLAQEFGEHVTVGLGGKYVLDSMGPLQRGSGMAFDAGLSMRFGMIGFGAAAQNALGQMRYGSTRYPFPTNYGLGVAVHHPNGVTAALDLNFPTTSYTNVRGGVEWAWNQHVALRAGYRSDLGSEDGEGLSGPTFGTGLGGHGLWLDYGYLLTGHEGGQHRIALSVRPSQLGWKPGDPFGQSEMRRDFDDTKYVGPPEPSDKDSKTTKSKESKQKP